MSLLKDVLQIKLAADIAKAPKAEVLNRSSWGNLNLLYNEDPIISARGVKEYRNMLRDSEVSAAVLLRTMGTMPGIQIVEANSSEEAAMSARLVRLVLDRMPGSTLSVLRDQVLQEALVTGFVVAEEVQGIIYDKEFGKVLGLSSIKVRPSEDFVFDIDVHGNINGMKQITASGTVDAPMDRVIYYSPYATPSNPYGKSVLYSAYDLWKLKVMLVRYYGVFMDANASGIKQATIEKESFAEMRDTVYELLRRMSANPSIVLPKDIELDIDQPGSSAGMHFINGIRELCNKEIRKAILYDESINAEGLHTASYASKEVAKTLVDEAFSSQGASYAEVLNEQLVKRILAWNGMDDYPVPSLIPIPAIERNADPAPILTALATAYQSGVIKISIPDPVQEDIVKRMVEGVGAIWPDDVNEDSPEEPIKASVELAAPTGRTKADMLKYQREVKASEVQANKLWKETSDNVLPIIKQAIGKVLFDTNGQWRPDIMSNGVPKLSIIRQRLNEVSHRGGSELRKALVEMAENQRKDGIRHAEDMTPKVAGILQKKPVSKTSADDIINQDVYMALSGFYEDLDNRIYYIVRNAAMSGASPSVTAMDLEEELDKSFSEDRSGVMISALLASAYVMGMKEMLDPNAIVGYKYDATYDDVTCDICGEIHNTFFKADDPSLPQPPMHPRCRCVLIPVFAGEEPSGWISDGGWNTVDESAALIASLDIPNGYGGRG